MLSRFFYFWHFWCTLLFWESSFQVTSTKTSNQAWLLASSLFLVNGFLSLGMLPKGWGAEWRCCGVCSLIQLVPTPPGAQWGWGISLATARASITGPFAEYGSFQQDVGCTRPPFYCSIQLLAYCSIQKLSFAYCKCQLCIVDVGIDTYFIPTVLEHWDHWSCSQQFKRS